MAGRKVSFALVELIFMRCGGEQNGGGTEKSKRAATPAIEKQSGADLHLTTPCARRLPELTFKAAVKRLLGIETE